MLWLVARSGWIMGVVAEMAVIRVSGVSQLVLRWSITMHKLAALGVAWLRGLVLMTRVAGLRWIIIELRELVVR